MISPTRFEKINGHWPTVDANHSTGLFSAACECNCGKCLVTLRSRPVGSAVKALNELLEMVLAEHRLITLQLADWACQKCGRIDGLSVHHKQFRSHGRDDRVENLEALDQPCHEYEHGRKASEGRFHPVEFGT